jgi:hypothetical protein
MIAGTARLESAMFSNDWQLASAGQVLATMRRFPRQFVTEVATIDGDRWLLEPDGEGVVNLVSSDNPCVASITRRSTLGRRWEITSPSFAYQLVSHPRPRRWHIMVGGTPVAEISGSLVSYNTVTIESNLGVPLAAGIMAWNVIARPWEVAARPRGIRAVPEPQHQEKP